MDRPLCDAAHAPGLGQAHGRARELVWDRRPQRGYPAPDLPAPGARGYFAGAGAEGTAALPAITQAPPFLTRVLT